MTDPGTACSGVILAGGLSKRFSGKNKAFLEIGGQRIIDRLFDLFRSVFEEVLIVTNDPAAYMEFDATIAADIFSERSSLTGIHAALFYARTPFVFVTACDTPFVKADLIHTMLDRVEANTGVVIPETEAGMEPLFAVYSKACLSMMERHIEAEKFKIQRIFKFFRIKKVSGDMLQQADPELTSFFNINTPEDLSRAESWGDRVKRRGK
ncbi:MAG: molybdenum cofactor guanylyltransferase [Desulfobacterales bacterium]|nr:molybdenum cofactor guanylyltransferase [Desulfobacterales bacterium]